VLFVFLKQFSQELDDRRNLTLRREICTGGGSSQVTRTKGQIEAEISPGLVLKSGEGAYRAQDLKRLEL